MKRKIFTIALAALFVVGTISIAISQGYGRRNREVALEQGFGPGMGFGSGMAIYAPTGLNLTKEQLEKLQALRTDFQEATLESRNKMQIDGLKLQQLWIADELDEDAILAKTEELSALRNQMQQKKTQHHLDVAKVLTKEQRTQFFHAARSGRRGMSRRGGRGRRSGMGRGHGRW